MCKMPIGHHLIGPSRGGTFVCCATAIFSWILAYKNRIWRCFLGILHTTKSNFSLNLAVAIRSKACGTEIPVGRIFEIPGGRLKFSELKP